MSTESAHIVKVLHLDIESIINDSIYQPRCKLDVDAIDQYAEAMKSGSRFPPVVVYFDGEVYRLSEGFHRVQAAHEAGFAQIDAEVRPGTGGDALWNAAGSNKEHDASGLRRTNKDKRRAVEMALGHPNAAKMSSYQIAEHCGVSHMMVQRRKEAIYNKVIDTGERDVERVVNGQTQTYTMKTGNIGKGRPIPQPIPGIRNPEEFYRPSTCMKCGGYSPDQLRLCEDHRFVCPVCGDVFDDEHEVWHCPGCAHHWLLVEPECKNCHRFERTDDGTIRVILIEDEDDEEDAPPETNAYEPLPGQGEMFGDDEEPDPDGEGKTDGETRDSEDEGDDPEPAPSRPSPKAEFAGWSTCVHKLYQVINGLKDWGGFEAVADDWPVHQRIAARNQLADVRDRLSAWVDYLEKRI